MADERILEDLRARIAASPFHSGFGLSVEDASEGSVRLGWRAGPEHLNLQGLVHGGVLATLADVAMGLAVRTAVQPGRRHVTIELTIHYVRPASQGDIEVLGHVIRVGSQIGFAEADVLQGDRLLARGSGTYSVTTLPSGNG